MRSGRYATVALTWLAAWTLATTVGCGDEYELPPVPPPVTQPASAPALATSMARQPACEPRYGGVMLAMDDGLGYVEWDVAGGRLYFVDADCQPAGDVRDARLYVSRPGGPEQITLTECDNRTLAGSCLASASGDQVLLDPGTQGVLRFELAGQGTRVALAYRPPATQPIELPPLETNLPTP